MLKKLQTRFILTSISAVCIVLIILFSTINIFNYAQVRNNAKETLIYLSRNGGTFNNFKEPMATPPAKPEGEDIMPPSRAPYSDLKLSHFGAETPFEVRFFSVYILNNQVIKYDLGQIAAIDETQAQIMALQLNKKNKEEGYYNDYRYLRWQDDDLTVYTFVDCERDLSSARSFLYNSIIVCLLGLSAFFILIWLLSRKVMEPIAESYAKQKQFITNASHELKTPLTVINSCADVLELEEGSSKWIDGIRSEVSRLSDLTNNLVSLSLMEEENHEVIKSEFSISNCALELVNNFTLRAQEEGYVLKYDIAKNLNYLGNEKNIKQLMSILLDNLLKYGDKSENVQFNLSLKGKYIVISTHNKTEMSEGKHNEIFERFYRGDKSRSRTKDGFGIGLSLAKSICEGHNGKIEAEVKDGYIDINAYLKV